MNEYIGVKLIFAEKQIKDGVQGYKVVYEDGYVSWSPADVFEKSYFRVDNSFDFFNSIYQEIYRCMNSLKFTSFIKSGR